MGTSILNGKSKKFGKIGIAKANTIVIDVDSKYEDDRLRFLSMATSLGVNFTGTAVSANNTNDRLDTLETDTGTINTELAILNNKMDAIAIALEVTFNPDGTLDTEAYTAHTHTYVDDNGTTTTNKTTQGID